MSNYLRAGQLGELPCLGPTFDWVTGGNWSAVACRYELSPPGSARPMRRWHGPLCDDLADHFTRDIGEAEVAPGMAVGQAFVIEA